MTHRILLRAAFALGLVVCATDGWARSSTGWDRRIAGSGRFRVIFDEEAVLDQETGLVWERRPTMSPSNWEVAIGTCLNRKIGNRRGWRLPRVDEMQSLLDTAESTPPLTPGHPFVNVTADAGTGYWTASDVAGNSNAAYTVMLVGQGGFNVPTKTSGSWLFWCVRGPGALQLN